MNWLYLKQLPEELRDGVEALREEYPVVLAPRSNAYPVSFVPGDEGIAVEVAGDELQVRYGRRVDAFRALGRLMGEPRLPVSWRERPRFDMLGVMVDVSRNAVLRVDTLKAWLRRLALMGINTLMLYTEDTYEVPEHPFFGYARGRYTMDELRELDGYAFALGIEMIPCVQALAHLAQVLQWPAFRHLRDTKDILLVGEPETYEFLERMIAAASAPYRTKRIHLGMDEAHGLGSGEYRRRHGERRRFDLMNEHLRRTLQITGRLGLRPMIWSDMYFRIGSKTGGYYDPDTVIPPEVIEQIPREVQLVYWDYYHHDVEFYEEWIDRHRALGSEPIVAPGAWTWNRFWAYYPTAFGTMEPCMLACKEKGIREVLMTLWGDDGAEVDYYSAMPVLQRFAEHGYAGQVDDERVRVHFHGSCGGDYEAWIAAGGLDALPALSEPARTPTNVSKWLLWEDPLHPLWQPQLEGHSFTAHYRALAEALDAHAGEGGLLAGRLRHPAQLARVLAIKNDFPTRLQQAYRAGDRDCLQRMTAQELPELRRQVRALWVSHRDMWLSTYKPDGLEVVEMRYGALMARLESLQTRLEEYLAGQVPSIPELEREYLKVYPNGIDHLPHISPHRRIYTPSALS